jgi:hypothetical protein
MFSLPQLIEKVTQCQNYIKHIQLLRQQNPGFNITSNTQWITAQMNLERILRQIRVVHPPRQVRINHYQSGIYHVCIDIIQSNTSNSSMPILLLVPEDSNNQQDLFFEVEEDQQQEHHYNYTAATLEAAWILLASSAYFGDESNLLETETVKTAVEELHLIEIASKELHMKPHLRFHGRLLNRAYYALIYAASLPQFAKKVVDADVCAPTLELIQTLNMNDGVTNRELITLGIGVLSWLARTCPESLRQFSTQIQTACTPFLQHLSQANNTDMLMLGFRCCRLFLRLFSPEECNRVVRDYPMILTFYPTLLDIVLDSGKEGNFSAYGSEWSLAGILMDLSIIASLDDHKPALKSTIVQVLDMTILYGVDYCELVHFSVVFLHEMCLHLDCLNVLKLQQQKLKQLQHMIESDVLLNNNDRDMIALWNVVMKLAIIIIIVQ